MLVPTSVRNAQPAETAGAVPPQEQAVATSRRATTRHRWLVGATLVVLTLVASIALAPDRAVSLVVRTPAGMSIVNVDDGTAVATAPFGQISPDGSVIVSTRPDDEDSSTVVTAVSATSGAHLWSQEVEGDHRVRLVSHQGTSVVLAPRHASVGSVYRPQPRLRSTFAIVDRSRIREYALWGNYEPEAFSLDGDSLFLIKYTPPRDPQAYQVRRFDLASDAVVDVFTPDEELQQEMGGSARTQVASSDGRRLYTLYTLDNADGTHETFVHVLALDELWAHCIHLPHEFTGSPRTTALALSPTGDRLYVADGTAGRVAEVDTEALSVRHTAPSPKVDEQQLMTAAVDSSGNLLVAGGTTVTAMHTESLHPSGRFETEGRITALQAGSDGTAVVGVGRRLSFIDLEAWSVVKTLTLPVPRRIDGFGTAPAPLPKERQAFQCAC